MRVAHRQARLSAPRWMGCPKKTTTDSNEIDANGRHYKEPLTASANLLTANQLIIGPVCTLVLILRLIFKFD